MMQTYARSARGRILFTSLVSATAIGLASLAAAPAAAQGNDSDSSATPRDEAPLDPGNVIIVTAQMREQSVQDIPLSITAISGDLLEARSQTRLDDISAQTPNVLLQQNPAGSGNSMRAFIRGVGQSDLSPSVEPGVGIYIDDIYFGTVTASAFDLTDLERVEVLRGPQGTLAGMNSEGGAIKLYSKKPSGEGGFVEATAGSLNRIDFKASADFQIVDDAVFARITGVTRNHKGYVQMYNYACVNPDDPFIGEQADPNIPGRTLPGIPLLTAGGKCKTGTLGDQKMYAVRGSLRIAPAGSPLEINVTGDYTNDTSATQASTLLASAELNGLQNLSMGFQGVPYDNRFVTYGEYRPSSAVLNDPFATYANFYDPGVTYSAADAGAGPPSSITPGAPNGPLYSSPGNQVEGWGVAGTIDYQLSDTLAIKSITGYRHYFSYSSYDNDNSPVAFIGGAPSYFSHDQFSQEVRLSGNLVDDHLHFTVGGIYYDADTRYDARIHTPFSGFCSNSFPCFSFINDDTASLTSYAGFANVAYDLTERLTLEGGIRVTKETKDYLYKRLNPDGVGDYLPLSNPLNPLTGQVGTYKETVTDYRAAASYHLTDDVMFYAQYATGFKGGGVSPRPYSYYQIRAFPAEHLYAYEVGFKSQFLDRRIRINGDVFYMDYADYQGTPNVCVGDDGNPLPADKGGVPGLCGQYLNVGDAEVKGFELEVFLEPVDGLNIDGSLSLTDFEFTTANYNTSEVQVGSSRPGIGDWKWSIGAQYAIDLGSAGTLTPRIDVAYTPGYCGNFACTPIAVVDSHTLANARVTYRTEDEDWSVSLEVTNLFDDFYYLNKFTNTWYASAQPGMPREWAVSVRRNF